MISETFVTSHNVFDFSGIDIVIVKLWYIVQCDADLLCKIDCKTIFYILQNMILLKDLKLRLQR